MGRSPADWCYWIRLHPLGQRDRLPLVRRALGTMAARRAPIELASEWPLHALLRHVDVHVTGCWSTVVIEAEDFGVASIACAERAREVFPDQVARGTLRVAATGQELVTALPLQAGIRGPRRRAGRPGPDRAMLDVLAGSAPARTQSAPVATARRAAHHL
jgi:hypothetical protein